MDRKTNTIKIGEYEIDILTYFTWGEASDIQAILYSDAGVNNLSPNMRKEDVKIDLSLGKAMIEAKYKTAEICIKKIKKGEENIPYSRDWLYNLNVDDGNKLMEAIDNIGKKKD